MVAVWSKEDSCGGNETLGLKKKANEFLGTHEGKIPEGFHNQQMGTLHDIKTVHYASSEEASSNSEW